ncbi:MAG: dTDP-Rha--alpha-D-GlcNAc-pyrophosphate polyprenol alpha-3-L-rhamnosyltransferase [Bacteroidetes bacterium]|nr:MAG: dTDP-Rha--alpha-D-GlcNAc-pyrophosphate polyprenol alpha-3-L-rhamnosyltransferase [Bacteroidota bacterium]
MVMETEPFVSIITLNYNQPQVTKEFLESTKKLEYGNYEILVCDMASMTDPATVFQAADYHNTRILHSKTNLGFAGGNNWGMRQAKGDYIFIVNNDTEVTPDLITRLLAPFTKDPYIGVTCPKIKYYSNPHIIQYAGFTPMNVYTGRTSTIGDHQEDLGQYDKSKPTFGAHGCAMMVKKEVIEKVGMFPETFFLYYEEWDWSMRIRKAGYTIWYTADATIYHKESMSVGKQNPMKVYYHTRNRILFMRRNGNLFQRLVFYLFFIFFTVPKAIFKYLLKGQFEHLQLFLKAVWWNLRSPSTSPI